MSDSERSKSEVKSSENEFRYHVKDAAGDVKGPYSFREIWNWGKAGYIGPNLLVRRISEDEKEAVEKGSGGFEPVGTLGDFDKCFEALSKDGEKAGNIEDAKKEAEVQNSIQFKVKDANGKTRGPFSMQQIWDWVCGGYFGKNVLVRQLGEQKDSQNESGAKKGSSGTFVELGSLKEFDAAFTYSAQRQAALDQHSTGDYIRGDAYEDYRVDGLFNARTGRFQAMSAEERFRRAGLPDDRDGRQLSFFLDVGKYQDQLVKAHEKKEKDKRIPARPPKGFTWKEVNRKKKIRKLIEKLGPD